MVVGRERVVKDLKKEGNGLRGRGFVRKFLTKKAEGFEDGKGEFLVKEGLFGTKKGSILEVKCNSLLA